MRFVNINVADFDAAKHTAIRVVGDARVALERLAEELSGWSVADDYRAEAARLNASGTPRSSASTRSATSRCRPERGDRRRQRRGEPTDVVVCAAGAMPGDLHKLWRTRDPKGYHVEYGYSCMGYEIAGGIGVKMAAPEREVYVLVGDGSYLMLPGELVTAVQEQLKLTIVLVDNHGFNSIGSLSRSVGLDGFGTQYRFARDGTPVLDSDETRRPTCRSISPRTRSRSARVATSVSTIDELREALERAKAEPRTTVIVVEVDRHESVPGYESWWDVPVAEVSEQAAVQDVRAEYESARREERRFL